MDQSFIFVLMTGTFKIFRLLPEDAERIAVSVNEPHVHEYEELLIGVEGRLEHFIDFESTTLEAPFVSFITKGKVHRVVPRQKDGKCDMWGIRFKSEFIPETTFHLYAYFHHNANIALPPDRCFYRISAICRMMYDEMQENSPDYSVVRHLLSALFTMIEAERKKLLPDNLQRIRTQSTTFKNFLAILEENFRRPEGVEFYAEKLFMSSRNLNIICQSILQQSVSEIIETRKLTEAKNLLLTTGKSISEIGYELGYNEKSYFTSVFKRKAGQTPTEFRNEMRKLIS